MLSDVKIRQKYKNEIQTYKYRTDTGYNFASPVNWKFNRLIRICMNSMRKITAAALVAGSLFLIQACSRKPLDSRDEVSCPDQIIKTVSFSSKDLYISKAPKMKFVKTPIITDEDSVAKQVVSEKWKTDCFRPSSVSTLGF